MVESKGKIAEVTNATQQLDSYVAAYGNIKSK